MLTKTITVTVEDIVHGLPGNACHCPVARAVKRILKPNVTVGVYPNAIQINLATPFKIVINLPKEVSRFIRLFDSRIKMLDPFQFDIEIPEQGLYYVRDEATTADVESVVTSG